MCVYRGVLDTSQATTCQVVPPPVVKVEPVEGAEESVSPIVKHKKEKKKHKRNREPSDEVSQGLVNVVDLLP